MDLKNKSTYIFILENINYFFAILISFLIPFHKNIPELTVLWLPFLICEIIIAKTPLIEKKYRYPLYFMIAYFLYISLELPLFGFDEIEIRQIEIKTGFLVFPIICLFAGTKIKSNINKIFFSYFFGFFIVSSYKLITKGFIQKTTYSTFVGGNPTWFSLYALLAISVSFYLYFKYKKLLLLLILADIVFIVSIFYAASRAGLITLIIIFSFEYYVLIKKNRNIAFRILSIIILLLIITFSLTNNRLKNTSLKSARIYLNLNGLKVLKENINKPKLFLFGLGAKETTNQFRKELLNETRLPKLYRETLDTSHNDFLTIFIKRGLIGFLLFVTIVFLPLIHSIKKKDILMFSFIVIMTTNFLLNDIFVIRIGTYFFAFFYSLLSLNLLNSHQNLEIKQLK